MISGHYGLAEMLNNAIGHSCARFIWTEWRIIATSQIRWSYVLRIGGIAVYLFLQRAITFDVVHCNSVECVEPVALTTSEQ